MTVHAAVVARGMGKCCVTACTVAARRRARRRPRRSSAAARSTSSRRATRSRSTARPARCSSARRRSCPRSSAPSSATLMEWVDEHPPAARSAPTPTRRPTRAPRARFGAEGIGLCRTEHMFFQPERILAVREMILAARRGGPARRAREDPADAARRLRRAVPRDGRPAGDDPPARSAAARVLAAHAGRDRGGRDATSARRRRAIAAKVAELTEANPMLGHRGCRLAITYPEIYEIQAQAIGEAAAQVAAAGVDGAARDHDPARDGARGAAPAARAGRDGDRPGARRPAQIPYTIGTMIELPRACVVADRIAEHADFFSFGTNDLTQTTFGLSRDDAGRFLPAYLDSGVLPNDPFVGARPRRGRRADRARRARRPRRPSRASRSASAASTAASRARSSSATAWASTTCPARRSGCRSPGSRRPGRRLPRRLESLASDRHHAGNHFAAASGRSAVPMRHAPAFWPSSRQLAGCTASAEEVRPPDDELFFPTGAAIVARRLGSCSSRTRTRSCASTRARSRCSTSTRSTRDRATGSPNGHRRPRAACRIPITARRSTCDEAQLHARRAPASRIGNFATDIAVQDTRRRHAAPVRPDARRSVDRVGRLGRHRS